MVQFVHGDVRRNIRHNYAGTVRDTFAFTFRVLAGRLPASPRAGCQLGLAYDFIGSGD